MSAGALRVLGVESSCDETAFAVVQGGTHVLSNAIASQVEMHARFGGVVPEIASRAHLESCIPMLRRALEDADTSIGAVDVIAATRGPGLAGCLLVGMEFAKGLALRHAKPFVPVHHIAGHLYSVFLGREHDAWGAPVGGLPPREAFPYLALVLSGGHSSMVLVRGAAEFEILGETMDDAVGEAYDKVAKLLGLGYPGGPVLDRLAPAGNPRAFALPRPVMKGDHLDFSFSGLKTAVARLVEHQATPRSDAFVADIAASFQAACIDVVLTKAERALERFALDRLAITGGVACNQGLRAAAAHRLRGVRLAIPAPEFCTDNAAMIAGLAAALYRQGEDNDFGLNAEPALSLAGASRRWRV